jgi:hypothetical protein
MNKKLLIFLMLGLFMFSFANVSAFDLGNGLVAQYKLNDNTTSNLVRDTLGVYNGTLYNGLNSYTSENSITGKINQAVGFDGVDDYVNREPLTAISINSPFTISTWIKTNTTGKTIIGNTLASDNRFHLRMTSDLRILSNFYNGSNVIFRGTSAGSIQPNTWTLITYVYNGDGTTRNIYVNGVLDNGNTLSATPRTTEKFIIGARSSGDGEFFNGSIDDVRIYNRTLTENEILAIYNQGLGTENIVGLRIVNGTGTQNYGSLAQNHTIGVEIGTKYLSNKWINYNGTNRTITGSVASFTLVKDLYNATIYANDTAGNVQSQVVSWNYKVFENSRSFTTSIVETSLDTFSINVTANVSLTNVFLNYNGTEYSTTQIGGVYSRQLTIPPVTTQTNVPVFWRFSYAGTNITSYESNQTISKLVFQLCNTTVNQTLVNFTTKSATNPFPVVNSTFKSSWSLSASLGATPTDFTYEDLNENKSSYAFCTDTNTTTLYVDAEIEYDASVYALNFYYLNDANLTATSPQNISLYLLNDSLATTTVLRVEDITQRPYEDYTVQVQLYDVGTGTFYLVGMARTDFKGEDILYLNWYDSIYRFIVLDTSGNVVKNTGQTKITASPTIIEIDTATTFSYDKFQGFLYNLYYENSTSNFVLTFTKPSGEVDQACLRVYKQDPLNTTLICNTCETSASATLFCNIGNSGEGQYIAAFYATGSLSLIDWLSQYIGGRFQETIYSLLGNEDASFYAFLFAGLITVSLFINAVFGVVALIIGIIGASAIGFTAIQWGQMTVIIIIGGFIIWLLKR